MKRFAIFLVVFALIFSNVVVVQASPEPKVAQTKLSVTTEQMKVGETITLTAETLKQGSGYFEEWDGALVSKSYLEESTDTYISEATFTPTQTGIYTISYTVKMCTGNTEVKFVGQASKTIEVISDVKEVIGLEVRNVNAYPNTNDDGTLRGYSVLGELFILWNDNTSTPEGTVAYFFLPTEKSRVVNLSVNIENKEYTFPVTISVD